MSEKVVKFSTLGRKEIKALIYTKNGEVKTEYNQDKIVELQEEIENPILIYNPDSKTQVKMQMIVGEISKDVIKEKRDIVISAKSLILEFLPLCSNVILDLDKIKDEELIQKIIKDASDEFSAIIREVGIIVKKTSLDYVSAITSLSEMPKKQLDEILKTNEPILTQKEKKRIELQKQIDELDKEEVKKE